MAARSGHLYNPPPLENTQSLGRKLKSEVEEKLKKDHQSQKLGNPEGPQWWGQGSQRRQN